jgi:hypothetical protein
MLAVQTNTRLGTEPLHIANGAECFGVLTLEFRVVLRTLGPETREADKFTTEALTWMAAVVDLVTGLIHQSYTLRLSAYVSESRFGIWRCLFDLLITIAALSGRFERRKLLASFA